MYEASCRMYRKVCRYLSFMARKIRQCIYKRRTTCSKELVMLEWRNVQRQILGIIGKSCIVFNFKKIGSTYLHYCPGTTTLARSSGGRHLQTSWTPMQSLLRSSETMPMCQRCSHDTHHYRLYAARCCYLVRTHVALGRQRETKVNLSLSVAAGSLGI